LSRLLIKTDSAICAGDRNDGSDLQARLGFFRAGGGRRLATQFHLDDLADLTVATLDHLLAHA
jgi:hypothetical protein